LPVTSQSVKMADRKLMKTPRVFLAAEWKSLLMLNYEVDQQLLLPHVPWGCELDLFQGRCYVSLVGFQFLDTRVKGCRFPFHVNFIEVNLRFYVRRLVDGQWRRGVVFIREIVPRRMITWIANGLYQENYMTLPMRHQFSDRHEPVRTEYSWRFQRQWMRLWGESPATWESPVEIDEGSEAEFLTEHYWGFTRVSQGKTKEYEVRHQKWRIWPLEDFGLEGDVSELYPGFSAIMTCGEPISALLAEGSPVEVLEGRDLVDA